VSSATQFGVAYFGVRDLDHASLDLEAMRSDGFAWVLLPMTQDDAAHERSTFQALVARAESLGLLPIVSLWGGGEFGGEGIAGPRSVAEWVEIARDTGAPILHVDEPKNASLDAAEVLDLWGSDAGAWLTIEPDRAEVLSPGARTRPAVIGTDAYTGSIDDRVAAVLECRQELGRLDLAWVRAFRILQGEEPEVGAATEAMADLAPHVGVWGWKGSTGRGELRSARPDVVRAEVARAIAKITQARAA
jgi:hypothetical protein